MPILIGPDFFIVQSHLRPALDYVKPVFGEGAFDILRRTEHLLHDARHAGNFPEKLRADSSVPNQRIARVVERQLARQLKQHTVVQTCASVSG